MTTIKLKNGSGAPDAADLVQGEVALDLTNKRIYSENASGTVIEMGTSPSTIDINAGTIDGTVIGGASAAAGTFTTANATTVDTTNIEVTNVKAKDGTASATIADSTGVMTIASSVLTTTDINGGTIDGVTIGGASAGAITGTTITGSGDMNIDSGTLFVDVSANRVGINTTTPAHDFHIRGPVDGTTSVLIGHQDKTIDGQSSTFLRMQTIALNGGVQRITRYDLNMTSQNNFGNAFLKLKYRNDGVDGPDVLGVRPSGDIEFFAQDGTTSGLYWDKSTSRLGLGTTAPATTLEVTGTGTGLPATSGTTQTYGRIRTGGSGSNVVLDIGNAGASGAWLQVTNKTNLGNESPLLLNPNGGNVGIGTASPTAIVHLAETGASDEPTLLIQSENSSIYLRTAGSSGSFPTGGGGNDGELLYIGGNFRVGVGSASKNLIFINGSSYTERMRIDSSGRVGIGTTSPSSKLDVTGTITADGLTVNNAVATITNADVDNGATLRLDNSAVSSAWGLGKIVGTLEYYLSADPSTPEPVRAKIELEQNTIGSSYPSGVDLNFYTTAISTISKNMTIASTGDISFYEPTGTTPKFFWDASAESLGIGTASPGARIEATASGAVVQILNRTTSDGSILEFEKDGTTVGSIGSEGGDALYIQSGTTAGTGLLFTSSGTTIRPARNGVTVDATLDLGSNTTRFKDLYLSGSVYLGGTTSANALDDYEEGTWTPTYTAETDFTSVTYDGRTAGTYVKIGKLVTLTFAIITDALSGGSGNVRLSNFPFTNQTATGEPEFSAVSVGWSTNFAGDDPTSGIVASGNTFATLAYRTIANGPSAYLQVSDMGTGSDDNTMYGSLIYYTA